GASSRHGQRRALGSRGRARLQAPGGRPSAGGAAARRGRLSRGRRPPGARELAPDRGAGDQRLPGRPLQAALGTDRHRRPPPFDPRPPAGRGGGAAREPPSALRPGHLHRRRRPRRRSNRRRGAAAVVEVEVPLPGRAYRVVVGAGAVAGLPELVGRHPRAAMLMDRAVAPPPLDLPALKLAGGEKSKTIGKLKRVLDFMEKSGLGRDGALVVVGGGSLGDLGGLAASLWLRGIACYQVPTTLLAMVDSSIGGKTGINTGKAKNAVGS